MGGEGKFSPGAVARHNDPLSGCRGHSCCLGIRHRSALLFGRARFPGGLSRGWKQGELSGRETKEGSQQHGQATALGGGRPSTRKQLLVVAALVGESPVWGPEVVSSRGEAHHGLCTAAGLQDLECHMGEAASPKSLLCSPLHVHFSH